MMSKFGIKNWAKISFALGFSSFALFAACTDYVGEIDDQIDELKELQARAESQKSSSSEEEEPTRSSSSLDEVVKNPSSSSRGEVIIITKPSSSSLIIIDDPGLSSSSITVIKSSSSVTVIDNPVPESSSEAEIVMVTGLGSCAPASTPINKGSSVKWKFSGNLSAGYKAIDFAKATFAWSFPGGSPAADATPSTSAAITYANSGAASASLTLTMQDGKSEVIQCSPLQVNGDPITGCKCTTPETEIDFLTQPNAVWTVSGCTSASYIISYTWDGVEGTGNTYTKTFEAAQSGYAPTLKIENSDKTLIEVTCPAVAATAGSSTCPNITVKNGGISGSGWASRYWDCCKPACSWSNHANGNYSKQCTDKGKVPNTDWSEGSVCDGGGSQMTCTSQSPFTIDGCDEIGFAFAAVPASNGGACGKCYQLTFDGKGKYTTNANHKAIAGKKLIIMTVNIGTDVGQGQFDIMIPGGGVGIFNGCSSIMGWGDQGAQYGGLLSDCETETNYDPTKTLSCLKEKCNSSFANDSEAMQGCLFLADFMHAAGNPTHNYVEVECPDVLVQKY